MEKVWTFSAFWCFFFKWPELQYVRFSEVTVRHKCHRDSTEEILLAWSSLCCWRAGGARLRVYTKQRLGVVKHQTWSWCVTRYQYCMSLYVFIYIDRTLYIIIYIISISLCYQQHPWYRHIQFYIYSRVWSVHILPHTGTLMYEYLTASSLQFMFSS